MPLKPVQDPALLAALEAPEPTGEQPVTDPALLAQLEGPEAAPVDPAQADLDSKFNAQNFPIPDANWRDDMAQPSLWEQFKKSGPGSTLLGAPEVALTLGNNLAVDAVAGLTGPLLGSDDNDSANFIRDFQQEHHRAPQGESAQILAQNLGDMFAPVGETSEFLGDQTMEATGSPAMATGASMLPDAVLAGLGLPPAVRGAAALPKRALKADPEPVNPMVGEMRAADIRLRPSDVRAMEPNKNVKVPGERRERFADAPDLKRDTTLHNQARFTDIVAKDIGAKGLDEASLLKAEEPAAATYDMVESVLMERDMSPQFVSVFREAAESAKLPKGEGHTITRIIGALRRRSHKRIQSDDVRTEEAGFADRDLADALEEQLGRELEAAGEPQLFKQYQDARQTFAKVNDARTATRANQIDGNTLFKIQKKTGRLTGGLKLVADSAEFAPNVTGHSLKTASRAGDEVKDSKSGTVKDFLKGVVRKFPHMDVGAEDFQRTLGPVDPVRAANYGRRTDAPVNRSPEQGELDIREALGLEMVPGQVGKPARELPSEGSPQDMFGSEFEFEAAPGQVGIPPEAQISLQELLGLGEPLTLKKSKGRVGKPRGE